MLLGRVACAVTLFTSHVSLSQSASSSGSLSLVTVGGAHCWYRSPLSCISLSRPQGCCMSSGLLAIFLALSLAEPCLIATDPGAFSWVQLCSSCVACCVS